MNKIMQENLEDLCKPALWRAIAAEFFGTLFLVLLGCGAIDNNGEHSSVVQIALTFGLTYGSMVWCFNHVSGGHFNPAVSVAAMVCRRASVVRGLFFIILQCVGAIAGAGILKGLSSSEKSTLGVTLVKGTLSEAQAFGIELLITFVFVFVVLASTDDKRCDLGGSAPLTIGLAVAAGHLYAVYWLGPIIGGFLAALIYEYIFAAGASFTRTKKFVLRHRKPSDKPKKNADEFNNSKVGLIESPPMEEGDAVVEMEKIEEEKKDEEAASIEIKTV